MTWLIPGLMAIYAVRIVWLARRAVQGQRLRVIRAGAAKLLLVYLGIAIVLSFLANWFLYHPSRQMSRWEAQDENKIEEVWLTSEDGTRLHAFWYPLAGAKWSVIYSHGNAGNLSHREWSVELWRRVGASVLIYDYPGYGRSDGRPSEAGCQAAGRAAYGWLRNQKQIPPEEAVLFGESLGCAMAIDLAVTQPHRALVLYAPFTSIADMAQSMFPWLPARLLVGTKYDNLGKLRGCHGPLFIAHGTADTIVPFDQGERLFQAAPSSVKRLFPVPDLGHNEALVPPVFSAIRDFLASLPPYASDHAATEMPPP